MKNFLDLTQKRLGKPLIWALVLRYIATSMEKQKPYHGYIKFSTIFIKEQNLEKKIEMHKKKEEILSVIHEKLQKQGIDTLFTNIRCY